MNKAVTFVDFVREHTAAVCVLAGLIILILGLLLYWMYVNGEKLAAALEGYTADWTDFSGKSHRIEVKGQKITVDGEKYSGGGIG